jgi:hypothetical protein
MLLCGNTPALSKRRLGDADVFALCETLSAFPDAPVTTLDLSYNMIGNTGAKAVANMLEVRF